MMSSSYNDSVEHTESGNCHLLALPPDVIFTIFSFLSTECLVRGVARTCTRCHDLLLPCSGRRTDQAVPRRTNLPRLAVRRRLADVSSRFWCSRWQNQVASDCVFLQQVEMDATTSARPTWVGPETPRPDNTDTTTATATSAPFVTAPPLRRRFIHDVSGKPHDATTKAAVAALNLQIRPLTLTVPASASHAPLLSSTSAFKAEMTAQLIREAENRSMRELMAHVAVDVTPSAPHPDSPEASSASSSAPPPQQASPNSTWSAAARTETGLLSCKGLSYLEQRTHGSAPLAGASSSLFGVMDTFDLFQTITFSADTYPPTKDYASEGDILTDAQRLCDTTQYALDCAYHQNFIAPRSLPCLRGEQGDTTTVETPEVPLVEDIDLSRHPVREETERPPQRADSRTATAEETTPAAAETAIPAVVAREVPFGADWVRATGGSPIAPDLLTVNVLWSPQRKTDLYASVADGFVDVPRGLGAFFPIALTPAALVAYEARREDVCVYNANVAREAADALPVPPHFPVAPSSEETAPPYRQNSAPPPPLSEMATGCVCLDAPAPTSVPDDAARREGEEEVAQDQAEGEAVRPSRPSFATRPQPQLSLAHSTPMPFLFPFEHVFPYLYLLEHMTFTDVKHHFWEPDEHKYAVCSRLVSPTADSVECRFFYSYYVGAFPRLHMKMVFSRGDLPRTLINAKLESSQQPIPLRRLRVKGVVLGAGLGQANATSSSSRTSSPETSMTFSEEDSESSDGGEAESFSFVEESNDDHHAEAGAFSHASPNPAPTPATEAQVAAGAGSAAAIRIRQEREATSLYTRSFLSGESEVSFRVEQEEEEPSAPTAILVVPRATTLHQSNAVAAGDDQKMARDSPAAEKEDDDEENEEEDVIPRHDPDTFSDMETLFVGGYGRVEVDVTPTVSKEGFLALREALGLSESFPISWLWNVVMCATGLGARMMHRHLSGFLFQYHRTFTDAMESVFGATACYGELYPWLRASVSTAEERGQQQQQQQQQGDGVEAATQNSFFARSASASARSEEEARAPSDVYSTPGSATSSTTTTTFDSAFREPSLQVPRRDRPNPFARYQVIDSDDDSSEFDQARRYDSASVDSFDREMWSDASGGG